MQRHYTRQKSYRDIVRVTVCVRNPIGSLCRDTVRVRNPVETLGSATVRQESYRDTTCHCVSAISAKYCANTVASGIRRDTVCIRNPVGSLGKIKTMCTLGIMQSTMQRHYTRQKSYRDLCVSLCALGILLDHCVETLCALGTCRDIGQCHCASGVLQRHYVSLCASGILPDHRAKTPSALGIMQRHCACQKSSRDSMLIRNIVESRCIDIVHVMNPTEILCSDIVHVRNPIGSLCRDIRDMTLNALKRQIQQKMGLNQGQSIMTVIYRYTVTVGSSMFIYQAVTINEDEDIDSMFDVDNRHECISFFELLIQYEQQSSSTTNVETTNPSSQIQQTQYTDYHTESQHEGLSS
ncbi:hypothetical protein JHK85_024821 [Glycine max]|nr:hypothetical protein JHK85_024821 [Glycine max]